MDTIFVVRDWAVVLVIADPYSLLDGAERPLRVLQGRVVEKGAANLGL